MSHHDEQGKELTINNVEDFDSPLFDAPVPQERLWPGLCRAIDNRDDFTIDLLFLQGLTFTWNHVRKAVTVGYVYALEKFLENGWNINEPWAGDAPPLMA